MKALIAEDNLISGKILDLNLRKHGFETTVVVSGTAALDFLKANPDCSLMITDILMPEMDGLTLLDRIRSDASIRHIPVIVCTSKNDMDTVRKVAALGYSSFLLKPINAGQLMQKVREATDLDKSVLEEKHKIMASLKINSQGYQEIIQSYGALIKKNIGMVKDFLDRGLTEPAPDLVDLAEGAATVGAYRIKELLDRILHPEAGSGTSSSQGEYQSLFKEMVLLEQTIAAPRSTAANFSGFSASKTPNGVINLVPLEAENRNQ